MDLTNVKIQYRISEQTEFGQYNSAMYFSAEEWQAMSQEQLDTLKQTEVQTWVNKVEEMSNAEPIEPTKEELEKLEEELLKRLQEIQDKINEKGG
jgi:hypothetical protein